MARPPEKLAQSLEILRNLQTAEGAGAIRARHNLIERLRGGKSESLDLDFSYHLEALFWPSPMPKYMDSVA
jgi:hypothetical protein